MVAFAKYMDRERQKAREVWLPSATIEVKDVEPIAIAKEVTVAATITNNAPEQVTIDLELSLSLGTKILFTCINTASRTPGPGKSMRVQISCPAIEKQQVPSGVTYSLKVIDVRPLLRFDR